jgi:Leucine-rich repeat (LRR) protein
MGSGIARLSRLRGLYVYSSVLTATPSWIGELLELRGLWLAGNKLTELPDSIGNLDKLSGPTLYNNRYYDLPESLAQLEPLTKLNLAFVSLTANFHYDVRGLSLCPLGRQSKIVKTQ